MEWNCISFYFYVVFCLVCLCFALFIDMSTNTADCANPPISLSLSSTADYLSLSPCLSHSLQRLRINLNRNQAKINRAKELHTKNARAAKCERHLSRKVGNTGAGAPGHPALKATQKPPRPRPPLTTLTVRRIAGWVATMSRTSSRSLFLPLCLLVLSALNGPAAAASRVRVSSSTTMTRNIEEENGECRNINYTIAYILYRRRKNL